MKSLLTLTLLATLLLPPPARAADPGDEIVEMCHNGVTIQVMRRFVPRRQRVPRALPGGEFRPTGQDPRRDAARAPELAEA